MSADHIRMSQGYDVLQPRSGEAYPIPCEEWDLIKTRLRGASDPPLGFQTAGSVLLGGALTTAISIIVGGLGATGSALVAAWAVVAVSGICGALCLYFARRERRLRGVQISEVIAQMELIERRYVRFAGAEIATHHPAVIQIRSAQYGARERLADVVAVLSKHVTDRGLRLKVENETLGGDPCPGTAKKLKVEYLYNMQLLSKVVDEHDWLELP